MTLTKCDLFFADKAIFVEGASERLLLPDMIEKCDRSGDFDSREYKLCDQYYSLIEVGGAYAYLFVPFVRFLDIPCLILTDLDSVSASTGRDGRRHYRSSFVSQGETTSNQTIKWWTKQREGTFNKAGLTALSDIILMTFEEKTLDNCHIEFQKTEFGLCGRSLEEAIKNVNRVYYNLSDNPSEEDIEFSEKSKTDFALDLIINYKDYIVPEYIRSGLKWLNEQNVLE